jgi:hypothetical protein
MTAFFLTVPLMVVTTIAAAFGLGFLILWIVLSAH